MRDSQWRGGGGAGRLWAVEGRGWLWAVEGRGRGCLRSPGPVESGKADAKRAGPGGVKAGFQGLESLSHRR